MLNYDNVNRLEIIDDRGRSYVKLGVTGMTFDLQDEGRTLKLFITSDTEKEQRMREELLSKLPYWP
jgi:hypothetical protein